MENTNPKAQIVDVIKSSTNILVTVSHNPSVDALSAALGFSLMLNKMDKHATAVFSGAIPPAISFLEPEKTFEGTVSSLRDFIIALDKEKADRLRYKVEGDVVRIYITPYKTTITQKDLEFSEGDFNVDLVIALGVNKQADLDRAITAHGRILHDATVVTVNLDDAKASVGTVDWYDTRASSLCEMLMSLSEALQSNLLDEQISTALLTGIVAATDRFSNEQTSPRVMTMSAQLMAAGANQQLIAEKLEAGSAVTPAPVVARDGTTHLEEGTSARVSAMEPEEPVTPPPPPTDGEMHVQHDDELPAVADMPIPAEPPQEKLEDRLEAALGHVAPLENLQKDLAAESEKRQHQKDADWREARPSSVMPVDEEPLMGGTLNATTSEAEAAKRAEERSARNHTLLSHDAPPASNPFGSTNGSADEPGDVDPFATPVPGQGADPRPPHDGYTLTHEQPGVHGKTIQPVTLPPINSPVAPPPPMPPEPASFQPFPPAPTSAGPELEFEETPLPPAPQNQTLADLEAEVHAAAQANPATSSIDDARNAVNSAFGTQPLSVGGQPTPLAPPVPSDTGMPLPPPLPNFNDLPPLPPAPGQAPDAPHPGAIPPTPAQPPAPSGPPAPGQFQIPGQ